MANTIVPTAGTRMTATVMPPELTDQLKPEFVAPLVAWMCSERCTVSGKIFTAGGGYFSLVRISEGPGIVLGDSEITVQAIAERMGEITATEGGREFESALEYTAYLLGRING